MSHTDDDRMLQELREALAPAEAEPSAAELSALRRAVAARFSPSAGRLWHRGVWRSWRPLRVLAVAAVLTFTGTAVAVSTGMPLPSVRIIARAVGLPVDSPAMADAKSAMRTLRDAMTQHDPNAVRDAAEDLRRHRSSLDPDDMSVIAGELEMLLSESDRFLAAEVARDKTEALRKRTLSGPGPTAGDDDEDPSDESSEIDPEAEPDEMSSDDVQDHAERRRHGDRAGHDEDPPGDSPDEDDDEDEEDDEDDEGDDIGEK